MSKSYLYDDIGLKRGHNDYGQGSYRLLPDHGRNFKRENMRDLGYTLYQDFQLKYDPTDQMRWWFKDVKSWEARIERIEQMGYQATDKLQIA